MVMLAMTSASRVDPTAKRDRPIKASKLRGIKCASIVEIPCVALATIHVPGPFENRDIYG